MKYSQRIRKSNEDFWSNTCEMCFDASTERICRECRITADLFTSEVAQTVIAQVLGDCTKRPKYPRPLYTDEIKAQIYHQMIHVPEGLQMFNDQELRRMYWLVDHLGDRVAWVCLSDVCDVVDTVWPLVEFWMPTQGESQ